MAKLVIIGGDGVAGGAGNRRHNIALLPEEGVGEGTLSHVGTAHNGDVRDVRVVIGLHVVLREDLQDFVQQVSGAASVGGRYAPDFSKAQAIEVEGVIHLFPAVHLVHAEDDGLFGTAEKVCYLGIIVRDAGSGLAHEKDYIGLLDGDAHLATDGVLEDVIGIGGVAARVHHGEFPAAPFALAVMPVTRYSGGFVNNGLAHSHQAVEQR